MKQKPLSINIIAAFYFLAPILNVARLVWVNSWPLTGPRSVFNHFTELEWLIMLLFPVVGLGVFRVARWGFYFFLGFSALMILHNSYAYFNNPVYSIYIIILFHLASFSVIG